MALRETIKDVLTTLVPNIEFRSPVMRLQRFASKHGVRTLVGTVSLDCSSAAIGLVKVTINARSVFCQAAISALPVTV